MILCFPGWIKSITWNLDGVGLVLPFRWHQKPVSWAPAVCSPLPCPGAWHCSIAIKLIATEKALYPCAPCYSTRRFPCRNRADRCRTQMRLLQSSEQVKNCSVKSLSGGWTEKLLFSVPRDLPESVLRGFWFTWRVGSLTLFGAGNVSLCLDAVKFSGDSCIRGEQSAGLSW